MTVAELRYALRDLDDDAVVVVADGEGGYTFGHVEGGQTIRGRAVVLIDLTAADCETMG